MIPMPSAPLLNVADSARGVPETRVPIVKCTLDEQDVFRFVWEGTDDFDADVLALTAIVRSRVTQHTGRVQAYRKAIEVQNGRGKSRTTGSVSVNLIVKEGFV